MSRDVPTVKGTKSIQGRRKHPYNQYTLKQKPHPSKQLRWTLSLSYQCHKVSIQYSQSPTKDARRQQFSFHVMKISRQKKQPPYTSNTCSPTLDYQPKSLAIGTTFYVKIHTSRVQGHGGKTCSVNGIPPPDRRTIGKVQSMAGNSHQILLRTRNRRIGPLICQ
jgi:hypothetical protein